MANEISRKTAVVQSETVIRKESVACMSSHFYALVGLVAVEEQSNLEHGGTMYGENSFDGTPDVSLLSWDCDNSSYDEASIWMPSFDPTWLYILRLGSRLERGRPDRVALLTLNTSRLLFHFRVG